MRMGACLVLVLVACRDDDVAAEPSIEAAPPPEIASPIGVAAAPIVASPAVVIERVDATFAEARPFSEGIAAVTDPRSEQGPAHPTRWGLLRSDGSWLVEPRFAAVSDMVGGRAYLLGDDGVERVLHDGHRERVTGVTWLQSHGGFVLLQEGQRGVIETAEGQRSKAKYSSMLRIDDDHVWALDGDDAHVLGRDAVPIGNTFHAPAPIVGTSLWIAFDTDGLSCITSHTGRCLFHVFEPPSFEDDIAVVSYQGARGIASRDGELLVPMHYADIVFLAPRVAALRRHEGVQLWTGTRIVDTVFTALGDELADDRLAVAIAGKWGFVDGEGKLVIAATYDEVEPFSEGRAAVARDGKWGFVDRDGTVLGALTHDAVGWYSEGLAEFERDGRWGYLDLAGKVVIEPQFIASSAFAGKHAWVKSEGGAGVIDTTGKLTAAPKTDEILQSTGAIAIARTDGHLECLRLTAKRGWQRKRIAGDSVGAFEHGRAIIEGEIKVRVDSARDTDRDEAIPPFWGHADVCGYVTDDCRTLWKLSEEPLSTGCLPFAASGFAAIRVSLETSCLTGPVCSTPDRARFIDRDGNHVGPDYAAIEPREDGRFRVRDLADDEWRVVNGPEPAPAPAPLRDGWRLTAIADRWRFVDARGQALQVAMSSAQKNP
jgi:hypothetical protein